MWCPECFGSFACPCKHCVARDTENKKTWVRVMDGEGHACPDCGFSLHLDAWLDIEVEQYRFMRRIGLYKDDE